MERFYIITDECKYKKDYLDYKQNIKDINEVVKEFFRENNIETSKYYVSKEQLYIVPTNNDNEKYDKSLNKQIYQGLRAFKKNCKINKLFMQKINDKGLEILTSPSIWMYINGFYGSMSTTTYIVNDTMYIKIETESNKSINEKGFKEIKASEYYLALESV